MHWCVRHSDIWLHSQARCPADWGRLSGGRRHPPWPGPRWWDWCPLELRWQGACIKTIKNTSLVWHCSGEAPPRLLCRSNIIGIPFLSCAAPFINFMSKVICFHVWVDSPLMTHENQTHQRSWPCVYIRPSHPSWSWETPFLRIADSNHCLAPLHPAPYLHGRFWNKIKACMSPRKPSIHLLYFGSRYISRTSSHGPCFESLLTLSAMKQRL